jgi:hypothetical protein
LPKPCTLNHKLYTLNPEPLHHKPVDPKTQTGTVNPKPWISSTYGLKP